LITFVGWFTAAEARLSLDESSACRSQMPKQTSNILVYEIRQRLGRMVATKTLKYMHEQHLLEREVSSPNLLTVARINRRDYPFSWIKVQGL
jgi:hypothetical protein